MRMNHGPDARGLARAKSVAIRLAVFGSIDLPRGKPMRTEKPRQLIPHNVESNRLADSSREEGDKA